jgi:hypothetical protein
MQRRIGERRRAPKKAYQPLERFWNSKQATLVCKRNLRFGRSSWTPQLKAPRKEGSKLPRRLNPPSNKPCFDELSPLTRSLSPRLSANGVRPVPRPQGRLILSRSSLAHRCCLGCRKHGSRDFAQHAEQGSRPPLDNNPVVFLHLALPPAAAVAPRVINPGGKPCLPLNSRVHLAPLSNEIVYTNPFSLATN